jgi:small-conductance mechanosensitive channel
VNVLTTPIHWIIIILGAKKAFLKIFNITLTKNVDLYYRIAIIILIAYIASRLLSFFIGHWLKTQNKAQKIPRYISNIVAVIIFLIALMIILSLMKISIAPILTSFGIAGLVVALSLQSTLTNFIAGIKIISEEKVKIGDFIDDGDSIKGVVEDMSLNSTRIRNINNNIIIVPNTKISDSPIINYVRNDNKIRLVVPVTVTADKPIDEIKAKLVEITNTVFETGIGIDKRKTPEV